MPDPKLTEIEDHNQEELLPLLIGKTILRVERKKCSDVSFEQGANASIIFFTDGTALHIGSIGYDADASILELEGFHA